MAKQSTNRAHKKAVTRTGAWKTVFLETLSQLGIVTIAADKAGIERGTAYANKRKDTAFAKGWAEALAEAGDLLEAEARRRAVEGVKNPVFYQGKKCGAIREYSDTLLIFLLKGCKPKKFRENLRHEVTGKAGQPIHVRTDYNLQQLDLHQLRQLRELALAAQVPKDN